MSSSSNTATLLSATNSLSGLKEDTKKVKEEAKSLKEEAKEIIDASDEVTLDFNATYETEVSFAPFPEEGIRLVTVEGKSDNAPFGLTHFESTNYSTLPDEEGNFKFSGDPEDFGLEGEEVLTDTFSGDGANKLFGVSEGTGDIDFEEGIVSGSGTIDVTGGKGIFKDASGTLEFEEMETLADMEGTATVTGSISVPI